MRNLLALPARLGGIALPNPTCQADVEFSSSLKVTEALKKAILKQSFEYAGDVVDDQMKAKDDVRKHKRELGADSVKHELSGSLRQAMDLAQERGASTWLTTQPIQEFSFTLHKSAFQDALALRYNWQIPRVSPTCACGTKFSVEHALSCPRGGFRSIQHNEIRDVTADLLTEVCNDVCSSLLRSAIQSIRGARSCCGRAARFTNPPADLAASELLFEHLFINLCCH